MSFLEQSMRDVLVMIDYQLDVLEVEAKRQGCDVSMLRSMNGDYLIIPLLVARANLLSSLGYLEDHAALKSEDEEELPPLQSYILVTGSNQEWAAKTTGLPIAEVKRRYMQSVKGGVTCAIPITPQH